MTNHWNSKNIKLRPHKVEDAEAIRLASYDTEAIRLLQASVLFPKSKVEIDQYIEKTMKPEDKGPLYMAIEDNEGKFVGRIALTNLNKRVGTASFFVFIFKDFRKKGFAQEAITILFKHCFFELRCQKINSGCMEGNSGSIRLHEKMGFKKEGQIRRNIFTNGKYYDDICFGLTKEEFLEHLEKN